MGVLLISRGTMSGGQVIGECLSRTAGYRMVTREDLVALVNAHGDLFRKVSDSIAKAAHDYGSFSALRRPYKILMRLALLEYVRRGQVAYFGYSGHLLLAGVPGMLRVRLIAPVEMRVRMLMQRRECSEEEARDYIRTVDEERLRWTRFMYARDIRSPEHYDLCINLAQVPVSMACSLLIQAAKERDLMLTRESATAVEDMYVATFALAALVTDSRTLSLEMGASAKDGCVCLQGPYLDEPERSVAMDIVRSVPGVREVNYESGYAPVFDLSC